jgi:hypothetical protein
VVKKNISDCMNKQERSVYNKINYQRIKVQNDNFLCGIYYMIIDKSHSKGDLVDIINDLNLPIVHSHQDNKKDLQIKFQECMKQNFKIKKNFYGIENKEQLITYLSNNNPKKTLSIKEKQGVMMICKKIIHYCKNNYDLNLSSYDSIKDIEDDMDYIKQFGDIPSCRRCCKLINKDYKFNNKNFKPLISPQTQKILDEKKINKTVYCYNLSIKREKIEVSFD